MAESATSIEDVLKGIIGKPTEKAKVVIERAPVQHFADAVLSTSPIYHSPEAAKQAGFSAIPAPPNANLRNVRRSWYVDITVSPAVPVWARLAEAISRGSHCRYILARCV